VPKREISWSRRTESGERLEICVEQTGDGWIFYSRERRPEPWEVVADPPLEDWLELLDAVERRIGRQLMKPIEAERIRKTIELKNGAKKGV
jgi:hypothetical protein